jgi:1-deoxy-D-xylulose-5-phosphate reductoisomerase
MTPKNIALLGSTGSIGGSTLKIVRQFPERFRVQCLSCQRSLPKLIEQIREFQPACVVVANAEQVAELRQLFAAERLEVKCGEAGLCDAVRNPAVDLVVTGIVGSAGLAPCFAALEAGKDLVFGNKESLVLAGELFMEASRRSGSKVLPMDSEHNAIFQALVGHRQEDVARLILTASGGAFRDLELEKFPLIQREDALQHPNWEMGNKITVDSATMMNKGLEVIEAFWLFGVPPEQIEVVVHRESVVHSLVEYVDGSFLAQLGQPDMRIPLAYCLAYPERLPLDLPRLRLPDLASLHFTAPEPKRYPCLFLALQALKDQGAAPAVLNGANEAAVAGFLDEQLRFCDIASYLSEVMQLHAQVAASPDVPAHLRHPRTLSDALAADQWGRQQLQRLLEKNL